MSDSGSKINRSISKNNPIVPSKYNLNLDTKSDVKNDPKYDINEKDILNPTEEDTRNNKRASSKTKDNIKDLNNQSFSRINSNQRKSNYTYYESKYSKNKNNETINTNSRSDRKREVNTNRGRRTRSVENTINVDNENKRYSISTFTLYNENNPNNILLLQKDYSSKKLPFLSSKNATSFLTKKDNSSKKIPYVSKKDDIPIPSIIPTPTPTPLLRKDNSSKKLTAIPNNYVSIRRDYSNKNLPFVSSSNNTNTNINLNTSNNTVYNTNTFTPSAKNRISQSRIQSLKDEPFDIKKIEKKEDEKSKTITPILKKALTTTSTEKTTTEDNNKEIIRRRRPNFPKYERRISDKNVQVKKKEEENKSVKLEKNENTSGRRKNSIDPGRRRRSSIKESKIGTEFSTTTYIKACEALSTAGRDDDGLTKINQDTYLLERNINGVLNFNIFGVLDGHGVNGHFASQFVTRYITSRIKNHPSIKGLDTPKEVYKKLIENGYRIIANIFIDADIQITKEKFNCEMSGTTCVIVIQLEEHLICANTGDSRAILVYDETDTNNKLKNTKIYLLSYDCKPELPNEKKRIEESGGTVAQMCDEGDVPSGPFRVWIKGEEYPGLAMSRSIGDMDAKKVGVIPNPQVIEYTLSPKTKYVLMCSDGIWEFISNEEAMNIANKYYLRNDAIGLVQDLTNISTSRWLKEDIVVDDITALVVFF